MVKRRGKRRLIVAGANRVRPIREKRTAIVLSTTYGFSLVADVFGNVRLSGADDEIRGKRITD